MDNYTFEDYLKDFELDYLGFDGTADDHSSELRSEQVADIDLEQESDDLIDDCEEDIHSPCLRFQK